MLNPMTFKMPLWRPFPVGVVDMGLHITSEGHCDVRSCVYFGHAAGGVFEKTLILPY